MTPGAATGRPDDDRAPHRHRTRGWVRRGAGSGVAGHAGPERVRRAAVPGETMDVDCGHRFAGTRRPGRPAACRADPRPPGLRLRLPGHGLRGTGDVGRRSAWTLVRHLPE